MTHLKSMGASGSKTRGSDAPAVAPNPPQHPRNTSSLTGSASQASLSMSFQIAAPHAGSDLNNQHLLAAMNLSTPHGPCEQDLVVLRNEIRRSQHFALQNVPALSKDFAEKTLSLEMINRFFAKFDPQMKIDEQGNYSGNPNQGMQFIWNDLKALKPNSKRKRPLAVKLNTLMEVHANATDTNHKTATKIAFSAFIEIMHSAKNIDDLIDVDKKNLHELLATIQLKTRLNTFFFRLQVFLQNCNIIHILNPQAFNEEDRPLVLEKFIQNEVGDANPYVKTTFLLNELEKDPFSPEIPILRHQKTEKSNKGSENNRLNIIKNIFCTINEINKSHSTLLYWVNPPNNIILEEENSWEKMAIFLEALQPLVMLRQYYMMQLQKYAIQRNISQLPDQQQLLGLFQQTVVPFLSDMYGGDQKTAEYGFEKYQGEFLRRLPLLYQALGENHERQSP